MIFCSSFDTFPIRLTITGTLVMIVNEPGVSPGPAVVGMPESAVELSRSSSTHVRR